MRQDSENEDYKAGRFFVFDDRLRLSDSVKYQLECSLDYPFNQRTTFGASVTPFFFTAERKTKPSGNHYVLIRKATPFEEREISDSDDDDGNKYYDEYLDEEFDVSGNVAESVVPSKLIGDLSDENLQELMLETMRRAANTQESAEVAFCKRGPSLEKTAESWWSVFGARFRAAAELPPKRPLEKTKLNLAAQRAQEKAESDFLGSCFLIMGVKHGMKVEEIPQWAMRCWWDVFGMRAKHLFSINVKAVSDVANVLIQAVVVAGSKTKEDKLIEAVAVPWFDIIDLLKRDPKIAFQIPPDKWEEIVAGSYRRAGFDEVILTPRSGDFGRDVIATKRGLGSIRVIDQVKAYGPTHHVTAEEVRALLGVLQADGASKGFLTTTSEFAPRLREDILLAPFIGPRLELISGRQLITRLSELALLNQ